MAWFDYLGGIAQGIGQASQQGLALTQQRKAQARQELLDKRDTEQYQRQLDKDNREEAMIELALREQQGPLTADDIKAFTARKVPANMFRQVAPGQYAVNKTLAQQAQEFQSRRVLEQAEAEKQLQDPGFAARPLGERIRIGKKAGRDVGELGLSPADIQKALLYDPAYVGRMLEQKREFASRANVAEIGAGARDQYKVVNGRLLDTKTNTWMTPPAAAPDPLELERLVSTRMNSIRDTYRNMSPNQIQQRIPKSFTDLEDYLAFLEQQYRDQLAGRLGAGNRYTMTQQ